MFGGDAESKYSRGGDHQVTGWTPRASLWRRGSRLCTDFTDHTCTFARFRLDVYLYRPESTNCIMVSSYIRQKPLTSCSNGWQLWHWLDWWHKNGKILSCLSCDFVYDCNVMASTWRNCVLSDTWLPTPCPGFHHCVSYENWLKMFGVFIVNMMSKPWCVLELGSTLSQNQPNRLIVNTGHGCEIPYLILVVFYVIY